MYDISNYTSFENLESWLMAVNDATRHQTRALRRILVANKGEKGTSLRRILVANKGEKGTSLRRILVANKGENDGGLRGREGCAIVGADFYR